ESRAALIPFVDDVVEILGARRAQRLEPEVVEDQQVGARVPSEAGLARPVGAAAGEVGKHLVGGDEEDFVAAAAGFVGERLREVALAHPGRNSHILRSFSVPSSSTIAGTPLSASS